MVQSPVTIRSHDKYHSSLNSETTDYPRSRQTADNHSQGRREDTTELEVLLFLLVFPSANRPQHDEGCFWDRWSGQIDRTIRCVFPRLLMAGTSKQIIRLCRLTRLEQYSRGFEKHRWSVACQENASQDILVSLICVQCRLSYINSISDSLRLAFLGRQHRRHLKSNGTFKSLRNSMISPEDGILHSFLR